MRNIKFSVSLILVVGLLVSATNAFAQSDGVYHSRSKVNWSDIDGVEISEISPEEESKEEFQEEPVADSEMIETHAQDWKEWALVHSYEFAGVSAAVLASIFVYAKLSSSGEPTRAAMPAAMVAATRNTFFSPVELVQRVRRAALICGLTVRADGTMPGWHATRAAARARFLAVLKGL